MTTNTTPGRKGGRGGAAQAASPQLDGAAGTPADSPHPAGKEIAWMKLEKLDGSGAQPEEEWREFFGDLKAMIKLAKNRQLAAILRAQKDPMLAGPRELFDGYTGAQLAEPNEQMAAGLRLCTKGTAKKIIAMPAYEDNGWAMIDALKAKWGFEQTAKLKRHGLWCVLFLTRCQGDESKEDYVMRVQRLMHDICDSYVDKAIKVDAVIADMAEAALIMGLDPTHDAEMIGNYHGSIDTMDMPKFSKMLIDHDKYRVSVRGREQIDHRLGMPAGAHVNVNYVRGKGGGNAAGGKGGGSSKGTGRPAPGSDFHCWTCGDTGHGVWQCESGLPKYQWRDRQGGSADASAAAAVVAATAEQQYQHHRQHQNAEQQYQQHSGSTAQASQAATVEQLNAAIAALAALQPQSMAGLQLSQHPTEHEHGSAAVHVATEEEKLTDMFRQAGYPSGSTGFAGHVSIETDSNESAAVRAHTLSVAEATGTDPRFLRPMTAAEISMYGCD